MSGMVFVSKGFPPGSSGYKALTTFVATQLGKESVVAKPFDMATTYEESSKSTPTFFVLFPGVDPTVWVEGLGRKLGFTSENGRFLNISMGQGQEAHAENALQKNAARRGGRRLH